MDNVPSSLISIVLLLYIMFSLLWYHVSVGGGLPWTLTYMMTYSPRQASIILSGKTSITGSKTIIYYNSSKIDGTKQVDNTLELYRHVISHISHLKIIVICTFIKETWIYLSSFLFSFPEMKSQYSMQLISRITVEFMHLLHAITVAHTAKQDTQEDTNRSCCCPNDCDHSFCKDPCCVKKDLISLCTMQCYILLSIIQIYQPSNLANGPGPSLFSAATLNEYFRNGHKPEISTEDSE